MQRLEGSNHALRILLREKDTGGFLKSFVPHLVPQYRDSNDFGTNHDSLLDNDRVPFPKMGNNLQSTIRTNLARGLGRDSEWVDHRLRMRATDGNKHGLDVTTDGSVRRLNTSNDLRRGMSTVWRAYIQDAPEE